MQSFETRATNLLIDLRESPDVVNLINNNSSAVAAIAVTCLLVEILNQIKNTSDPEIAALIAREVYELIAPLLNSN